METKKTSKNAIWKTNRNYTTYSSNGTSCRLASKSIFGGNRRYCWTHIFQ